MSIAASSFNFKHLNTPPTIPAKTPLAPAKFEAHPSIGSRNVAVTVSKKKHYCNRNSNYKMAV